MSWGAWFEKQLMIETLLEEPDEDHRSEQPQNGVATEVRP